MSEQILGKDVAQSVIDHLPEFKQTPKLAIITANNDPASKIYVRNKLKKLESLNIPYTEFSFDPDTVDLFYKMIIKIDSLNNDPSYTGIMIQMPLPDVITPSLSYQLFNKIDPIKDVDGFTNTSIAGTICGTNDGYRPCTPAGIIKMLEYANIDVTGKHVVVVGRSDIVGKPIAAMMIGKSATVTVCHSKTVDLKSYTKKADILIVAVGKPSIITSDMVKKGVVLIDVGINRVNGKVVGDIDPQCYTKSSYYTPVPGGVGVVTVAMLMNNVVESANRQVQSK